MLKNVEWTRARDLLLSLVSPLDTEAVPLADCGGRVLGFDLLAPEDVPAFDRSPYDGYALRAADVAEASPEQPVVLRVSQTVPAGQAPALPVVSGSAARLMTGAAIPPGADCVVMFEKTRFTADSVTLSAPLRAGDNIVRRGEDVRAGDLLAARGTLIGAGLAGALAAQGFTDVRVYRRPLVGLISTGSEVVEAWETPTPGKIRNSNRSSFTALLASEGCRVEYLGLAGDEAGAIAALIRAGLSRCDAVVLTGGVSVGDWDVTPEAMTLAGAEPFLRGVSMKPGMACAYGLADGKPVLGLSGNPASSLTNFCVCCLPALRKLRGLADPLPRPLQAALLRPFRKRSPSCRFLRGRLVLSDGAVRFDFPPEQGNAVLSSVIGCDAFLEIPAGSGPQEAGTLLSGFMC